MNEILASDQIGFPILSMLIGLPILAAVLMQFVRSEREQRAMALTVCGLELALALLVVLRFVPGTADIQFAETGLWMPLIGAAYHLGVDGISVLFLPLTAFVILLALLFYLWAAPGRAGSTGRIYCCSWR